MTSRASGRRLARAVAATLCLAASGAAAQERTPPNPSVWLDVIALGQGEADRLIAVGNEAEALGDTLAAREAYIAASAAAPSRYDALAFALRALCADEAWSEAIARSDRLDTEPYTDETVPARFYRALALSATGEWARAAEQLFAITRYRPNLPGVETYLANLAELYVALGDVERAVLFYRQALAHRPRDPGTRMGLAAALLLTGRTDEAREHTIQVLIDDPEAGFLRQAAFYVPEGTETLYGMMLGHVAGRSLAVNDWLASWGETELATLYPDVRTRIGELASPAVTALRQAVDACVPLDAHARGGQIAVSCEYAGLRLFPEGVPTANVARAAADAYDPYGYSSGPIDIAIDASGAVLTLHSEGRLTRLARSGQALVAEPAVYFEQPTLTPQSFVPGSARVVFAGSSGGFMIGDPQPPLVPALVYGTNPMWMYDWQTTADEQLVGGIEGTTVEVLQAPTWNVSARIPLPSTTSRFSPWTFSADGADVFVAGPGTIIRYATATGTPRQVIELAYVIPEAQNDPYEGVTLLRGLEDGRLLVGVRDAVYLLDFVD